MDEMNVENLAYHEFAADDNREKCLITRNVPIYCWT